MTLTAWQGFLFPKQIYLCNSALAVDASGHKTIAKRMSWRASLVSVSKTFTKRTFRGRSVASASGACDLIHGSDADSEETLEDRGCM